MVLDCFLTIQNDFNLPKAPFLSIANQSKYVIFKSKLLSYRNITRYNEAVHTLALWTEQCMP